MKIAIYTLKTKKVFWKALLFIQLILASCSIGDSYNYPNDEGKQPTSPIPSIEILTTHSMDPLKILHPTSTIDQITALTTPMPTSVEATSSPMLSPIPHTSSLKTQDLSISQPSSLTTNQLTKCKIGTALRQETANTINTHQDKISLVNSASTELAKLSYSTLTESTRVLSAPSLINIQSKADQAIANQIPFEVLGYGLETSDNTPDQEWQDLINSIKQARNLTDDYGKLLMFGPGFRLMSKQEDLYPVLSPYAHFWLLQTQRLQIHPPGDIYRGEVERIVNLIKSGNPEIKVWAQITILPDRQVNPQEWLAYRNSISDMVDGTYIGVYIWNSVDSNVLTSTIESILEIACAND